MAGRLAFGTDRYRPVLGISSSPYAAGERVPGQVLPRGSSVRSDALSGARALAPDVMLLAEQTPIPRDQLLLHPTAPARARDVAKGLGLDGALERRLGGVLSDTVHGAANEAEFRKDLMGRLIGVETLDTDRRRLIFQRGLAYWRQAADAGELSHVRFGRRQRLVVKADSPLEGAGDEPGIPTHKVRQRGRVDPVRQVMGQSRQALPAGAVRIHYSADRGGYVRAEKQPDGTWRVLGEVHKDHEPKGEAAEAAKKEPLQPKDEHPSSSPKGKEPIHDSGGHVPSAQKPLLFVLGR